MSMIKITNLTIEYDGKKVLDNFSHTFENGSFTAIMGESGIGKTSLINAVLKLISYSGTIIYDSNATFSAVFQEDRLCENLSALKNITMTASSKYSIADITKMAAMVNLDDLNEPVSKLSGGMKRRVAILRALLADYDVLALDEPFKGLDDATKTLVMSLIRKMASERTVLLVTHNPSDANYFNAIPLYL